MTTTAPAEPKPGLREELSSALAGHTWSELLEHVAMVALLAIWAVPFTRATGGRGVHNELLFAAALLLLLPALQAWRAPTRSIVLAALTAAAAELVCVFAPSHWYGSDVAAGYAIAAGCFVAGRRYVRDADRRMLVAVGICLAGIYQFEQAFLAWHGGQDPTVEMSGTFYWHNPYAAFLLPGAVLGLGLIANQRFPGGLVGWFSMPLCTAGIVFSSSRATMAALVAAWVMVFAIALRSRAVLARVVGAVVVTAGVVLALPGPPLFPHYSAPWAATTARAATGQTLTQNGVYRTEFWREAIQVFLHRPLVGSGFHVLASASAFYTPSGWARSPLAHDGYLQSLSDGGLLLGLPFLAAATIVLWWALRLLWKAVRRGGRKELDVLNVSFAVALLAGLAHSAVDFDWSHPSILVETALLAACVAPPAARRATSVRLRATALAVLGAVLVALLPALHQWQIDQPNDMHSTGSLLANGAAAFGDYRPAQAVLDLAANDQRTITRDQAREALAQTASEARVDLHLALLRDAEGAQTGLIPNALAAAKAELRHVHGSTVPYIPDLALVELDLGQDSAAKILLANDVASQVVHGGAAPDLSIELKTWASRLGRGSAYACQLKAVHPLLAPAGITGLPKPTAACPAGDQGAS